MARSCKHKQNSHHKQTSVWKGYPVQQLLLTASAVCFVLTLAAKGVFCRIVTHVEQTPACQEGLQQPQRAVCYWGNSRSQSSTLASAINTWGETRNAMLPSGPRILYFFRIYLPSCFRYIFFVLFSNEFKSVATFWKSEVVHKPTRTHIFISLHCVTVIFDFCFLVPVCRWDDAGHGLRWDHFPGSVAED